MQPPSPQFAEAWKDFFITAAGASAALAGLVIVAISVNVQRILEQPQLPSRGGATVAALVLILVTSMAVLIPQPSRVLGIEIVVFGIVVWPLQL
jgi:modulator of FtsH protease